MREDPNILADLGRKLAVEVVEVVHRKADLVYDDQDKLELAKRACEAALGAAAAQWAITHRSRDLEKATTAIFDGLRQAVVIAIIKDRVGRR